MGRASSCVDCVKRDKPSEPGELNAKYSPDLNPIELAFSKLKTLLRKAAERTIPGLCRRIGKLIAAFSARECTNYFSHAGYVSK
jgi:hypothetical protein